jgi:Na+/melibiose symporter-like transporter
VTSLASSPSRLSPWRLFAFSLPGVPIGALAVAMQVYAPRYYASHFRLGLGVGAVFMIVRLVDMPFDPVIGVLMDRTRSRLGRYRIWLAAGAPLLAIPVVMLFAPPFAVSYGYLLAWLVAYYLGSSVVTLAHMAWASVAAGAYHERSRIFGVIQVTSIAAAILVLIIASQAAGDDDAGAVRTMGWFIAIAGSLAIAITVAAIRENVGAEARTERFSLRDYWEMIARPDMRRIVIADVCLTLGPNWMSATYLFYFHDSRGFSDAASSYLLAIYVISGVFGASALSWLATRIGKHRTLMISAVGFSLQLMGINFMPKGAFAVMAVFMFVLGFLSSSFTVLIRAMIGDVGDAVLLETGRNRFGVLFSFITSMEKIANALSIGLTFGVLSLVGYDARQGATNSAGSIHGLEAVFLLGPIAFVMIGGACFLGYKLDHRRHAEIRRALDEREAASAP